MNDSQLEELHSDIKKRSEKRGKRGGLGKESSSSTKRIQIEYVEKIEAPPVENTSDLVLKHQPFIRFVPATIIDSASSKHQKHKKETDNGHEEIKEESDKQKKSSKEKSKNVVMKVIQISKGKDILESLTNDLIDSQKKSKFHNGFGILAKVTLLQEDEEVKIKNVHIVNLQGKLGSVDVTVIKINEENGEKQVVTGRLIKSKTGKEGVLILAQVNE